MSGTTDAPPRPDPADGGASKSRPTKPGPTKPGAPGSKRTRRLAIGSVALCVAAGLVAYGLVLRSRINTDLAAKADREALPQVTLIAPRRGPKTRAVALPGTLKAWNTAPIYAQVSGYVQKWLKDYGATVKAGDVLATIDTPALDEQYQQAQSSFDVAKADYNLAVVTAKRWQDLLAKNAVSVQETDVKTADAAAAKAKLEAAQHDVERYKALEAFKRVTAPFDGVVTARDTDIGDYVNGTGGDAGNPSGSGNPGRSDLFKVSDVHVMRVFISVPQDYSESVGPDAKVDLTFSQFPNRTFPATFETSAKSFDQVSRTVLVELLLPNPDGRFYPGTYTEAHFSVPTDPDVFVVPEQAILFRSQGLQVCLVDAHDKVHLRDVKVGHNLGATVQVTSGLEAGDRLIANPSDGLLEGQAVHVVSAPKANTNDEAENGR